MIELFSFILMGFKEAQRSLQEENLLDIFMDIWFFLTIIEYIVRKM